MKPIPNLFPADTYDTPEGRRTGLLHHLLLGNRFNFYLRNFYILFRTGCCARRGALDAERQVYFSNCNFRLLESCGGRVHLRGLDNLRQLKGRPVVLMGNHMSSLETSLLHAIVRPHLDFTFVIKESLLKIPFFGDVMRSLEAIPVRRQNPRDDFRTVLTEGRKLLARGRSIILFPQATRSVEFNEENFNSIGVKLARAAGVDILPFVLKTDFLSEGGFGKLHPENHIYFEFFPAMSVADGGREQLRQVINLTVSRLREWKLAPAGA